MFNPLAVQSFMSRIYSHCDSDSQSQLKSVSKNWHQIPDFIQYRILAERNIKALNEMLGLKTSRTFEYALCPEHIEMDIKLYKFDLWKNLPSNKRPFLRIPIESRHPFSKILKCALLSSVPFRLLKDLRGYLKGNPEERSQNLANAVIQKLSSEQLEEALLILDIACAYNAMDEVFVKVMTMLIQQKDYKNAIEILAVVFKNPSVNCKEKAYEFLNFLIPQIESMKGNRDIKRSYLQSISNILRSLEKPNEAEQLMLKEKEDSESRWDVIGGDTEDMTADNVRALENQQQDNLSASISENDKGDRVTNETRAAQEIFNTLISSALNGMDQLTYLNLRAAALSFPLYEDVTSSLEQLLEMLRYSTDVKSEWIGDIERLLGINNNNFESISGAEAREITDPKTEFYNLLEAAERDFDVDTYIQLKEAVQKIPNILERYKGFEALFVSLQNFQTRNYYWIDEIETIAGFNQHDEYDEDMDKVSSDDKVQKEVSQKPNNTFMTLEEMLNLFLIYEDGKDKDSVFESFFEYVVIKNNLEEAIPLLMSLDSFVKDKILLKLISRLRDPDVRLILNDNINSRIETISCFIENQSLLPWSDIGF